MLLKTSKNNTCQLHNFFPAKQTLQRHSSNPHALYCGSKNGVSLETSNFKPGDSQCYDNFGSSTFIATNKK